VRVRVRVRDCICQRRVSASTLPLISIKQDGGYDGGIHRHKLRAGKAIRPTSRSTGGADAGKMPHGSLSRFALWVFRPLRVSWSLILRTTHASPAPLAFSRALGMPCECKDLPVKMLENATDRVGIFRMMGVPIFGGKDDGGRG
jgi:hypothetical protein